MIASSYPLLDIFWTMFEVFIFFIWIMLLLNIFGDIFRSHDLSGGAKAMWSLFVIILPLLGSLIYLLVRGGSMHERAARAAQAQRQAFDTYVQHAAGSSPADQLTKLADLKDRGVLTDTEFAAEKAKLLA
jgi:hypothetical protein